MNKRALLKALRFVCLPTILFFLLVLLAFADFSDSVNYVFSKDEGAAYCRVFLGVAEIGIVCGLYFHYCNSLEEYDKKQKKLKKEKAEEEQEENDRQAALLLLKENNGKLERKLERHVSLYKVFDIEDYGDTFEVFTTPAQDTKIVRRIPKKK